MAVSKVGMREEADVMIKRHSRIESTGLGTDLVWKMKTNEKVKILASRLRKGPCENQKKNRLKGKMSLRC